MLMDLPNTLTFRLLSRICGSVRVLVASQCVINSDFGHFQIAAAIRFSDSQFDLRKHTWALWCRLPWGIV